MNEELPKSYIAKDHESSIYDLWVKNNAFKPSGKGAPFSILMPPPNANEGLHVGHALMVSTEDIMARYARMQGKNVAWFPGTDHAGFETQVVYEKKLQKEGKSRFEFAPEELRDNIRQYVLEQQNTILSQIKLMGASCDWDRQYFTLDDSIVSTVYNVFSRMHEDELLYRAKRLVNYCTKHGTSFSDLEVEYEDKEGALTYITYPIKDASNTYISVATTRPETMLGDVAIAVHPEDKRYKDLIGQTAIVPLVNREIPIIEDKAVDPLFGSGAVKITPAHSHTDFAIAQIHKLPTIEVINTRGKLFGDIPADLQGLKAAQAREEIVSRLHELNLIEKIETHHHRVGVCYKCKTPIEILPLQQWWVKTKPLAQKAIEAIESGAITITPIEAKHKLTLWLENIIDWNISRQIVWGIPIPAWYKKSEARSTNNESNSELKAQGSELDETEIRIQADSPGEGWIQDTDTFDTWFSSSQLPYAALGYPNSKDYKTFFPTSVMETGSDILYWWVARMIMMSLYTTKEVPFKHIYLHGMVLGADGKKMSKSKGNVVDPIALMDKYGTDGLRWALVHGASAGQNFSLTEDRVVGGRNLANKLWNATRFVLSIAESQPETFGLSKFNIKNLKFEHKLSKQISEDLDKVITETTKHMNSDSYALATDILHDFFWHTFCDTYLEQAKTLLQDPALSESDKNDIISALIVTLTSILKMFHPFMPYVTEKLWQELYARVLVKEPLLITARWPKK